MQNRQASATLPPPVLIREHPLSSVSAAPVAEIDLEATQLRRPQLVTRLNYPLEWHDATDGSHALLQALDMHQHAVLGVNRADRNTVTITVGAREEGFATLRRCEDDADRIELFNRDNQRVGTLHVHRGLSASSDILARDGRIIGSLRTTTSAAGALLRALPVVGPAVDYRCDITFHDQPLFALYRHSGTTRLAQTAPLQYGEQEVLALCACVMALYPGCLS